MAEQISKNNISSSGNIELSFSLTRNDILRYNLHFNFSVIILAIVFMILMVPGLILALKYPSGDLGMFFVWIEIGLAIGFIICLSVISAIVLQVFFMKSAAVEQAMQKRGYIINSAGVAIYTDAGHLARTWREFRKISRTRHGYYLRTTEQAAIILPLWAFKAHEDIKAFQALVKLYKN